MRLSTCTTRNMHCTPCNAQRVTCNTQRTTCDMQCTLQNMRHRLLGDACGATEYVSRQRTSDAVQCIALLPDAAARRPSASETVNLVSDSVAFCDSPRRFRPDGRADVREGVSVRNVLLAGESVASHSASNRRRCAPSSRSVLRAHNRRVSITASTSHSTRSLARSLARRRAVARARDG